MKSREALLAALKEAPDALLLVEEIRQELKKEAAKRGEFYDLIHENIKAEFINGEVIYHSPVKRKHWRVSTRLARLLDEHVTKNNLGEVGVEKVMISLTRNDYEPGICFFSSEKAKHFTDDQMHFPAPDFVVEILSDSTKKQDYGIKFRDYAAHGISEYWIIDTDAKSVEQYVLHKNEKDYALQQKVTDGRISSVSIQDFAVNVPELFG